MNHLIIKEKLSNRTLLINATHLVSISFNNFMNTIIVETIFTNFQCSSVEFIDEKTVKETVTNFNQLIKEK